jgi:hypothetical protein
VQQPWTVMQGRTMITKHCRSHALIAQYEFQELWLCSLHGSIGGRKERRLTRKNAHRPCSSGL